MPYFQGEPGLLHGEVRQGLPGVQGGVPHLQLVGELSLEGSATWNWQQEKTVKIESDSEQKTSQNHHRPSQGDDDDCDDGDDDDIDGDDYYDDDDSNLPRPPWPQPGPHLMPDLFPGDGGGDDGGGGADRYDDDDVYDIDDDDDDFPKRRKGWIPITLVTAMMMLTKPFLAMVVVMV